MFNCMWVAPARRLYHIGPLSLCLSRGGMSNKSILIIVTQVQLRIVARRGSSNRRQGIATFFSETVWLATLFDVHFLVHSIILVSRIRRFSG